MAPAARADGAHTKAPLDREVATSCSLGCVGGGFSLDDPAILVQVFRWQFFIARTILDHMARQLRASALGLGMAGAGGAGVDA